ncbi:hypothetical protein ACS5PN_26875 [Roseateles sp. NT4]|uniref:hypothetical protein n=1 Tax=Roseateles sp. NT4 TaxID=3453715 RepID=UPI003EEFA321
MTPIRGSFEAGRIAEMLGSALVGPGGAGIRPSRIRIWAQRLAAAAWALWMGHAGLGTAVAAEKAALTADQVKFFSGVWDGVGQFASGRRIEATFRAEPGPRPDSLRVTHVDKPPLTFNSTSIWSNREGELLVAMNDSSGGFRLFTAEESSADRLVLRSQGQLDHVLRCRGAQDQERFIFERVTPDEFKMTFEKSTDGQSWRLVDFLNFRRKDQL